MNLKVLNNNEIDKFIDNLNKLEGFEKNKKYRFYNMAQSEYERLEKEESLIKLDKNIDEVTIVNDNIAIAKMKKFKNEKDVYYKAIVNNSIIHEISTYTFDEALLLALMRKYDNINGFSFVAKALGMKIGE